MKPSKPRRNFSLPSIPLADVVAQHRRENDRLAEYLSGVRPPREAEPQPEQRRGR